jgi:uncharacterized protein (DUF1501 family)
MQIASRRDFLRTTLRSATALGAAGSLAKLAEMTAHAAVSGNYQALVCIYLGGGNNGHNTVVPIATAQQNYSVYQTGRGSLAIPMNSLLPISAGDDVYGLHSSMPEIQSWFRVCSFLIPIRPGNGRRRFLPDWGVQVGAGASRTRYRRSTTARSFPRSSISGCGPFCTGQSSLPATVPSTGPVQLTGVLGSPARSQGVQQLLAFDNGLQLVQAGNGIVTRGSTEANTLVSLLPTVTIKTPFPAGNPLGSQLLMAAKLIALSGQLSLSRQIFFCQLGGFDTHSAELPMQQMLLQQLSQSVGAFYAATQELQVDRQVVTFTTSEFGRTLSPNGNAGTDHAWGNHHFIIGTAVKGGSLYGTFPSLTLGSENDTNTRGTLIPTTAVDQYGATLAQWFGITPGTNMLQVFPNLGNFSSANLGFLG